MKSISFDKKKISTIPSFNFKKYDDEITNLKLLCNNLKKKNVDSQALKNYIIIRLVGIIENQLRSIVSDIVDEFKLQPSKILDENSVTLMINDLDEFKSEYVTKGKIVTMSFRLQNAMDIKKVLSRINHLDFFNWYQQILSINNEELKKLPAGSSFNYLEDVFKLRNDVVHNLKNVEYDSELLINTINNLNGFARLAWILSAYNLSYDDTDEIKQLINKELKISPDEFKKITKKLQSDYVPKKTE